jgi:transformation/transcription domain-associated protein
MLGHTPAGTPQTGAGQSAQEDEDTELVHELEEEFRVKELLDPSVGAEIKNEILGKIRAAFEKHATIASSSLSLQQATLGPLLRARAQVDAALLEYVSRIPISDIPKDIITDLLKFCLETLNNSHEDNGAMALEILSDVFKAYKSSLEELSVGYLEWLVKLFDNIPDTVEKYITNHKKHKANDLPLPAVSSIKLSQDIAMTAFSLFQAYGRKLASFGPDLVSKMVSCISLSPVPIPPETSTAFQLYTEFKLSQVKTLIFLVILSRSQTAQPMVSPFQQVICDALVSIMQTSPSKNLNLRKEILNAFRTLLASDDLNKGLVSNIEQLVDMDCLIGTDSAVNESLKQVAFIHLTELLLLVKQDINVEFIQRVVDMAIDSLMDTSGPLTLRVTSVRVLYNIVVDIVFPRRAESEQFRDILSGILGCMRTKFDRMCAEIPRILSISRDLESLHKKRKEQAVEAIREATRKVADDSLIKSEDQMDVDTPELAQSLEDEAKSTVSLQHCFKTVHQSSHQSALKERELLEFRNLAHGLVNTSKTVAYVIIVYHTSRGLKGPVPSHIKPWSSRKSDVRILCEIMRSALKFISIFERLVPSIQNFDPRDVLREMYNVIMDHNEYVNVVAPNMPYIFELVLANPWYLGFVKNLLEEDSSSESRNKTYSNRYAIACVLNYLVEEKIDALKDINSGEGAMVLQLFQMCFELLPRIQNNDLQRAPQLAANGVPGVERVVQPYVLAFLKKVTPLLSETCDRNGYMKATRSLFFALAATNKFLDIQASVGSSGIHVQIVDTILMLMNSPLVATKEIEEICAEICLLVPARLEHLIPLIPRMMRAAVVALNSSDRSVHIALRVLDVWVESFNPEFIERSMSRVKKPLMTALWSHIKPQSHGQFGHKVASMLGKMGGRGRRWLGQKASVDYKDIPEYGMRVILAFPPHTSFLVPLDRCVQLAWTTLTDSSESHRRRNALRLLQICAETLTRLHLPGKMLSSGTDLEQANKLEGKNLRKLKKLLFDPSEPPQIPADLVWPAELGVKTKKQHAAEKKMLETILIALVSSSTIEEEIDSCESRSFAHATCRHFAFLMAAGWSNMAIPPWAPPTSRMVKYDVLQGIPAYVATLKHLQPHILLDAFEKGLQREAEKERRGTIECMCVFLDTLMEIGNAQNQAIARDNIEQGAVKDPDSVRDKLAQDIPHLSIQQELVTRARHCCYGDSWASKLGGAMALDALSLRISSSLLAYAAHYMIKALMMVLRSFPDVAIQEIQDVTSVITSIVKRVNGINKSEGKKDEEDEEEDDDDEPQMTTRRGKRPKRTTRKMSASRKKQKTVASGKIADGDQSKDSLKGDRDSARLHNDLLQAVMSSKNNDAVRAAATQCLELVSTASGTTIGSMLDQILNLQQASKSLLERRILPLRSVAAQTNYAYSTAFLLRHYPALSLSDSLCTFVADCCTILEQDEASIASCTSVRGQQPRQGVISKLRHACLEVLVESLGWTQFMKADDNVKITTHKWESMDLRDNIIQEMHVLRSRIVTAFVRNLGSKSDKIINVSKHGLRLAKDHRVIDKINLNDALLPLLTETFSISSLSTELLSHLHHLLDVISESFQDTLGNKFVEHLQAWVDYEKKVVPALTAAGAPSAMEPGTECELAVKMLDVFHKFPDWAAGFLESQAMADNSSRPGLVVLTIGLEQCLSCLPGPSQPSVCWSPYRGPLVRYLSKYPDQSIDYFVQATERLSSPDYFSLFLDIINHPSGLLLLECLKERNETILGVLQGKIDGEQAMGAKRNCIQLVRNICKLSPNWLPEDICKECIAIWKSETFKDGIFEDLTSILLNYSRRNISDVDLLLQLPHAFIGGFHCDSTELKEYLTRDFPRESSSETKHKVRLCRYSRMLLLGKIATSYLFHAGAFGMDRRFQDRKC